MVYLALLMAVAVLAGTITNRVTARAVRARTIEPEWLAHLRWELDRR
jgi:hypothetical protein